MHGGISRKGPAPRSLSLSFSLRANMTSVERGGGPAAAAAGLGTAPAPTLYNGDGISCDPGAWRPGLLHTTAGQHRLAWCPVRRRLARSIGAQDRIIATAR